MHSLFLCESLICWLSQNNEPATYGSRRSGCQLTSDENMSSESLRDRIVRQGEDAVGRIAQDALDNKLVKGVVQGITDSGQKVFEAREVVFGVLDLSSASDLQKLTRRLRSVSQRLEDVEDGVDRLSSRVGALNSNDVDTRIEGLEGQLEILSQRMSGDAVGNNVESR